MARQDLKRRLTAGEPPATLWTTQRPLTMNLTTFPQIHSVTGRRASRSPGPSEGARDFSQT